MTAILIDDMQQATELLLADLNTYCPDIKVIGTADSIVTGAKLIRKQEPDILFLDISLGDGTGFDLLEIFPNLRSQVIFVTAYDEHAIKAFQFSATDYLLKPIDSELLQNAVAKARNRQQQSVDSLEILKESVNNPQALPSKIALHTQEKITIANVVDIIRCEAESNYTKFYFANGQKIFVTRTLKYFENLLKDHPFIRVHQSHLINFNYIREFSKQDGGYLILQNKDEIPVSVRKRAELMQIIDQLNG